LPYLLFSGHASGFLLWLDSSAYETRAIDNASSGCQCAVR